MTTNKLEYRPCILPSDQSMSPMSYWYPTERSYVNKDGCDASKLNDLVYDNRYISLGMPVSEYDV